MSYSEWISGWIKTCKFAYFSATDQKRFELLLILNVHISRSGEMTALL